MEDEPSPLSQVLLISRIGPAARFGNPIDHQDHLISLPCLATVSNLSLLPYLYAQAPPPLGLVALSQGRRFLHWLTSKSRSLWHPSTTTSTPEPVTRTQPRTLSSRREVKCRPMLRSEGSETAEPQKERSRCVSEGQPRARTSVAVSERAQQKDCVMMLGAWMVQGLRDVDTCTYQI